MLSDLAEQVAGPVPEPGGRAGGMITKGPGKLPVIMDVLILLITVMVS